MKKVVLLLLVTLLIGCSDRVTTERMQQIHITRVDNYNSEKNTCEYRVHLMSDCGDDLGFTFTDTIGKYQLNDTLRLVPIRLIQTTQAVPVVQPIVQPVVQPAAQNIINITNN